MYPKLLYLLWNHGDYYHKVIPLMGEFYQLMILQKVTYKRHGCMDYKQWFSDAEIIAAEFLDKAIEGRQYYRCMRIHKEAFDALVQLRSELLANNNSNIDQDLADDLLFFYENPSLILSNQFQSLKISDFDNNWYPLQSDGREFKRCQPSYCST